MLQPPFPLTPLPLTPSPSPPSPSPPSPSPLSPHPPLPHPLPLTPLPLTPLHLTLLAWLKMTVSLRFKKGSVTKFLLVSMIQSAMIVIFQCLSLSYLVANLTIFCLAFHTVSIILSRGLLVNCCVKYTITTTNLFCLSFLSFTGHRDHS